MDNVCCATEQTKVSSSILEAAVHSLSFLDSNQYCTFFTFCSAVGALEAMWWLTAYQRDWNFNGNAQIHMTNFLQIAWSSNKQSSTKMNENLF